MMFVHTSRSERLCLLYMVRSAPLLWSHMPLRAMHLPSARRPPGTIFDVVSTDNPINIAYSNIALDLHQDLPYYESPPGVQLLHCLKFSASVTGASTITSARAAVTLSKVLLVITSCVALILMHVQEVKHSLRMHSQLLDGCGWLTPSCFVPCCGTP